MQRAALTTTPPVRQFDLFVRDRSGESAHPLPTLVGPQRCTDRAKELRRQRRCRTSYHRRHLLPRLLDRLLRRSRIYPLQMKRR